MKEKERLKEMAKCFREAADVIDEILENEDKSREDELLGKFMVKMIRLHRSREKSSTPRVEKIKKLRGVCDR